MQFALSPTLCLTAGYRSSCRYIHCCCCCCHSCTCRLPLLISLHTLLLPLMYLPTAAADIAPYTTAATHVPAGYRSSCRSIHCCCCHSCTCRLPLLMSPHTLLLLLPLMDLPAIALHVAPHAAATAATYGPAGYRSSCRSTRCCYCCHLWT